ncbi:hypothetical protein BJX99DRAFT_251807 [Aspergillus californicus]
MTFLASVFVLLRFLARRHNSVQWDDWTCLVSLVVAYSFLAATVLMVTIGEAGHHVDHYDQRTVQIFVQSYIATDILAAASFSLTKVSILLFYRRIFAIKSAFRKATWVVAGLIFGFFVSTTCGLIFPSNPVEAEWKPWIPRTHIHYKPFWVSFGCINLALDIAVLALPQPLVWGLKMSRRRKIQLSLTFLLGAFVCVTSIIRISVVARLDMDDQTYSLIPVTTWNAVEVTTGIICACLPMMPALFRRLLNHKNRIDSDTTASPKQSYTTW